MPDFDKLFVATRGHRARRYLLKVAAKDSRNTKTGKNRAASASRGGT